MTPELRESYTNACYQLHLPAGTVELAVGRYSAPLAEWMRASGCACSALLTAFNPASIPRADALNRAAQAGLEARLLHGGCTLIPATAIDPCGGWPPEPGVLVSGLAKTDALAIARDFGQLAILWCGADAIPQLVETGDATR
jgi:hypothetical protein